MMMGRRLLLGRFQIEFRGGGVGGFKRLLLFHSLGYAQ
jgi:hypothetical protein